MLAAAPQDPELTLTSLTEVGHAWALMAKAEGPGSLRAPSLPSFAPFSIASSLFPMTLGSVLPYFLAFQSTERRWHTVSYNCIYKTCNFWAFLLQVVDLRIRKTADGSEKNDQLWNPIVFLNLNVTFIYYLCVCVRVALVYLWRPEDTFVSCFSLSTFDFFLQFELRSSGSHGRWLFLMLSHLGISTPPFKSFSYYLWGEWELYLLFFLLV